ncbi:MAG: AbrB/MazE/SpoVT family DNA-binding domain-containing protein [Deltaproteobacteria bacterium]|jgi:AbrB family looped-hinge helix DNA binding protein|nr:AbrB/MazE/SpoVT family DNA-binding domain-containing protein [Deltaproteobacteria bacterium]
MKIGERGQVTIPKKFRHKYGLLPNIEVDFVPQKEGKLIKKKTRELSPVEQVYGILNKSEKTDVYME